VLVWETVDAELLKFGETSNGNPSLARHSREGVETGRAALKLRIFRRRVKG
jgi:hypothetical protein